MRLKIYQSFFNSKEYRNLDKAFIPFNNIENKNPELREYPLLKKLHEKNINFKGHWGMVSWRWKEKTKIPGEDLIKWIEMNPGYDVYIINPYSYLPETLKNTFIQGESDHPGMLKYTNKLLEHLGYNFNIEDADFPLNIFSTCHFYIGNSKFWDNWMSFIELTLDITQRDGKMFDYMYNTFSDYHGNNLMNYCFVIERLVSLFLYLNYNQYKILHYPYQLILNKNHKEMEFTEIQKKAFLLNTIY